MRSVPWARLIVSAFFIAGGLLHLIKPEIFTQIMPGYLPWHEPLVLISGVCELAGGLFIWLKPFRRWAGISLIALCVFVFPANIHMAMNTDDYSSIPAWLLYLRLPLQGVIIFVIHKAIY